MHKLLIGTLILFSMSSFAGGPYSYAWISEGNCGIYDQAGTLINDTRNEYCEADAELEIKFAESKYNGTCLIAYEYDIEKTKGKIFERNFPTTSRNECEQAGMEYSKEDLKKLSVPRNEAGPIKVIVNFIQYKEVQIN